MFNDDDFYNDDDDDSFYDDDDPERYLDDGHFSLTDDYLDAVSEIDHIYREEGEEAAWYYAQQFTSPIDDFHHSIAIYQNQDELMSGKVEYKVIYTNSPIGEDTLNKLANDGFRLVFMVHPDQTSWITYIGKDRHNFRKLLSRFR